MRVAAGIMLAISLAAGGCQTASSPAVYLDPASNLGTATGQAAVGTGTPPLPSAAPGAIPVTVERDAQGQPNSEFDGQSWIEYRRGRAAAVPRAAMMRPRPGPVESIPLLPMPGEPDLDPRQFDPRARR